MDYSELSLEDIKRQIEEAEARRAQLEKILEDKREQSKGQIVEQIRSLIFDNGYDPEEIMNLVLRRRRKLVGHRQYRRYVDPDNPDNIYIRGVLPGWMKQKMVEKGYDPSSKADREAFKSNYLKLVEG
ncbi:H-NS histone family protein [Caldichromatium japonicum]|uniref:H-NS histone family protein n=1 Tax=Caldichromatium japonicum TaxID=2699430 RepID=A0A6G7VG88_9GAMM|nr:H-NS histone family protein [Caldichromatium japonicum]QIK38807.1 H-NS histone family protein [Caldichromatium japonicum]